jgi:hypothetical protein
VESSSSSFAAEPIASLIASALWEPIAIRCSSRMWLVIASSRSYPPTRRERETTMPPSEITATSLVPPPTSTTIRPIGSAIGIPAPIAAASDSSIR